MKKTTVVMEDGESGGGGGGRDRRGHKAPSGTGCKSRGVWVHECNVIIMSSPSVLD